MNTTNILPTICHQNNSLINDSDSIATNNNAELKNRTIAYNKYQQYIATKEISLTNDKRLFVNRLIPANKDCNEHHILIYNSKEDEAFNFNHRIQYRVNPTLRSCYACRNFSFAVSKGVKPKVFNSIDSIKNNPCLNDEKFIAFRHGIPNEGYYFKIDNFFYALKSLIYSFLEEKNYFVHSYLFISITHVMSLTIQKKSDILQIKFYDPNKTNIETKVILFNPEDLNYFTLNDFISEEAQECYFAKTTIAALLSNQLVASSSTIKIVDVFGEIDDEILRFMLYNGHYNKHVLAKNNVINISKIFDTDDVIYNKSIEEYIEGILQSDHSIEDKIAILFNHNKKNTALNVISFDYIFGFFSLFQTFLDMVATNKNFSDDDKVKIINSMHSEHITLLLPVLYEQIDYHAYKTKQLEFFTKYINFVLNNDNLTSTIKLSLLDCSMPKKNIFWPYSFIDEQYYLDFFIIYLKLILDSDRLTEQEKEQLLTLNLPIIEKEELLYKIALNKHNNIFIINYIKSIIASKLTNDCKRRLLHIENDEYRSKIFVILYLNHKKECNFCISQIPSYTAEYYKHLKSTILR